MKRMGIALTLLVTLCIGVATAVASIYLHESGHFLAMLAVGGIEPSIVINVKEFTCYGVVSNPTSELIVAFAGGFFSALIIAIGIILARKADKIYLCFPVAVVIFQFAFSFYELTEWM